MKDISVNLYMGCAPKYIQIPYDIYISCRDFIFPPYRYNWWDKIKYRINPNQKWIKKYIEYYQWNDKTVLIPDFLFGCVIHFIEGEECFKRHDWEESGHGEIAKELKECYEFAIRGRQELNKAIDDAYDRVKDREKIDFHYEYVYEEVNTAEKNLENTENKWCMWIIQNRGYLWA